MTIPKAEQQRLNLHLEPADIIRDWLAPQLEPEQLILDAGAGTSRNGHFLRGLGHTVVSLSPDQSELDVIHEQARATGTKHLSRLVHGDIDSLDSRLQFDVVLFNEVFGLFENRHEGFAALERLRSLTRPFGLHAVSGYVVVPPSEHGPGNANHRNTRRHLHSVELLEVYTAANWDVMRYEETNQPHSYWRQGAMEQESVNARAKILARKPGE